MVTKTYFPSNLFDSSNGSEGSESSDIGNSRDQKTFFTKKLFSKFVFTKKKLKLKLWLN